MREKGSFSVHIVSEIAVAGPEFTDAELCTGDRYRRASKTLNNRVGFERGLWRCQSGRFGLVSKKERF